MLKKISMLLAVLLALGLYASVIREGRKDDQALSGALYQMKMDLRPIDKEISGLHNQLLRYNNDRTGRPGTVTFIYNGLERALYNDIYPMMKEKNLTGMITVNQEQFPGEMGMDEEGSYRNAEDYISEEEYLTLLDVGWKPCLLWERDIELEDWLERMERKFRNKDWEFPHVILFPDARYRTEYDELLKKHGITVALHHGEEDLPIVSSGHAVPVWHLGVAGGMGSGRVASDYIETVKTNGSSVAIIQRGYDDAVFYTWIEDIGKLTDAEQVYFMDPESAMEYRNQVQDEIDAEVRELSTRLEELSNERNRICTEQNPLG